MAQIQKFGNPSLTLYAFHLRTSISQGPEQTTPEASQLWEQLAALGQTLGIRELQELRQKLICYENGRYQPAAEDKLWPDRTILVPPGEDGIDFQAATQPGGLELNGFLCPFRLHDTYAIDLTFFYEDIIDLTQLSQFNTLCLLLFQHVRASLGQTLVLYGEAIETQDDYQPLADACVTQLLQGIASPELVATGSLLGNPVFEYDNGELDPARRCHIFVWLRCHSMAPEQMDEVSEQLLYLLWCRHKILYVYHLSRWCDKRAKQLYGVLEQYTNNFKQIYQTPNRLQQFKDWLLELPDISFEYARCLRDLEDHKTTTELNAENYKSRMVKLATLPNNKLSLLEKFIEKVDNKFHRQIQADRSYLEPGIDFSERLINSIRTVVAIEQVESDRQLQIALLKQQQQWEMQLRKKDETSQKNERKLGIWIAAVGTGLAVSGVSSQVNPTIIETFFGKPNVTEENIWHLAKIFISTSGNIFIHVFFGLMVALLVRKAISWFVV